jgi:hypothetical protein
MAILMDSKYPVQGAGLGLRRGLLDTLADVTTNEIRFMDIDALKLTWRF